MCFWFVLHFKMTQMSLFYGQNYLLEYSPACRDFPWNITIELANSIDKSNEINLSFPTEILMII